MVYITNWNEFQQRSVKLYAARPDRVRYLLKARAGAQSLTLKVTDDETTLKYRTRSVAILGRLDVFNRAMMLAMAGSRAPLQAAAPPPDTPTPATTAASAPATATVPAPDKKKKKKKGKK
jgi:signal recognition particle subunit SRP9